MSEELGVRSEELVGILRHCPFFYGDEPAAYNCNVCLYADQPGRCQFLAVAAAADELERLAKEKTSVVWHEVTTRPMTDDEISCFGDLGSDAEEIYDCEMPVDGQEILVATAWGVDKDVCTIDEYGIGLEGRGDWDGVYAWAEMPTYHKVVYDELEPYREPYATIVCETEKDFNRLTVAAKRAIPQSVVVNLWDKWIECPACGEALLDMDDDDKPCFCRYCGQALLYEEAKEDEA